MITYWLYKGDRLLTAVRLPPSATLRDVIAKALYWHRQVPLPNEGCAPFEWERKISNADSFHIYEEN